MQDFLGIGSFYLNYETTALFLMAVVFFLFGALGFFPIFVREDEEKNVNWWKMIVRRVLWGYFLAMILCYFYLATISGSSYGGLDWSVLPLPSWFGIWVLCYLLGLCVTIYNQRVILPYLSNLKHKFRISQTGDQQSDVRVESAKYESAEYDPKKYFKPGYMFRGLDENNEPVYESLDEWKSHNQASIGPSQVGKGVDMGLQLYQSIIYGFCVILFDQKPDKFARAIMFEAAKEAGREIVEIDLNGQFETEKYGFLKNGSRRDKRTRLISIAGLESSGNTADYYKNIERRVVDDFIDYNPKAMESLDGMLKELSKMETPPENLYNILREIKSLQGVSDKGINIRDIIEGNKILYIRGNTVDNAVRAVTKILLTDITQTLFATAPELGGTRQHHVAVFVDEARFIVSQYLANALATVKATLAHFWIAYQSKDDVRNIDDDSIDKDALQTSIDINTTSKLIYQAGDPDTQEWASKLTGTVIKNVTDRAGIDTNTFGGEEYTGETMLTNVEEAYIHPNTFLSFPLKVGVRVMQGKLAQIIKTHWIEVDITKYPQTPIKEDEIKKPTIFKKAKKKPAIEDVLSASEPAEKATPDTKRKFDAGDL